MYFNSILLVAGATLAAAATTPNLQPRVQACNDLCKNNIGKCDNKDSCVTTCNNCINANFGFFPNHQCGCTDSDECAQCQGCTQGCGSLDTDAAIAACYISCSTMDICNGC